MQLKFLMVAKQPMWWKWSHVWFFWPKCRDELNHAETMSPFVTLKELIISQRTSLYIYVVLCSSLSLNIYANSVKVFSGIFSKLNNNHILKHLVIWNSTKTSKLFRDYLFNDCTLSVIMVLSSLSYTTEGTHIDEDCDFQFWQTTCLFVTLMMNRNIPCRTRFQKAIYIIWYVLLLTVNCINFSDFLWHLFFHSLA